VGEKVKFRFIVVGGAQFHAPSVELNQPCPKVTVDALVVTSLAHHEADNVRVVRVHSGILRLNTRDDAMVAGEEPELMSVYNAHLFPCCHVVYLERPRGYSESVAGDCACCRDRTAAAAAG
jgi:hypothetical protein